MPHLPAVEAYVSHDEVYGEDLSRAELDGLLRGLSLDDCLQTIGKLGSSLAAPGANPQQLDAMVAGWLPAHRELTLNLIRVGRRLLFPSRLSVLARLALEVTDRRPADAFGGDGAEIGRFARALLGVTSVFDVPGRFDLPDRAQVEDELARLMLRRLATRSDVPLAQQFVRYWRMLVELPQARGDILVAAELFR